MKQIMVSFLVALTLLLGMSESVFSQGVVAQKGLNADGKDFYVGWLYPSYNDQSNGLGSRDPLPYFGVYVLVSSYTDNQFTVSYFDNKGKETGAQNFSISKRRAMLVPCDRTSMRMTDVSPLNPNGPRGEIAEWKSMHITAKKPINVQFFSSGANSGGSYLSLPVNVLGKEYVIESYKDNPVGDGGILSHEASAGYFMVIAPFNGTDVQIIPNSTTAGKHPGVNCGTGANGSRQAFNVGLQRGQCYMVKSAATDGSCNISGTTVVANNPIVVIAGHENALTEGSYVGETSVEQRDYMVEQMLPVEYWDSTGYYSIPMVDSKSAPGGDGDEYDFFYGKLQNARPNYPNGTTVHMMAGDFTFEIGPYQSEVSHKAGVTLPVSAYDLNGVKFHMVQYDQRMQGGAPYPAPSQMTIMPESAWKAAYLWYVPSNLTPQEVYQGYYISLICNRDDYNKDIIQIAQDGGPLTSIRTGLPNAPGYPILTIPGHPELMGVAKKLNSPRAYYASSTNKRPFMIYNYGFRAIDADRDLGDFCSDDHFFGYALPVGFAASTGDSSYFVITVDTLCARWNLCATVSGTNTPKIKSITLLNDPTEDLVDKPNSSTGYESYNVRFDPKDDPDGKGEISLPGDKDNKCVTLYASNPLDSAYAAVLIVDDKGNFTVAEIYYKASTLADTIRSVDFNLANTPWELIGASRGVYHKDSILYPITGIGDSHFATVYYYNNGDSTKGTPPITVNGAKMGGIDGSFVLSTVPSTFPVTLRPKSKTHPADTLAIRIVFTSKDTLIHIDTMTMSTDCFDAPVLVIGPGGTPLITATDYNFGAVAIGSQNCSGKIVVRNQGNLPFLLTKDWVERVIVGTGGEFTMDPVSAARLVPNGYTLYPPNDPLHPRRDSINLYFCYAPKDIGSDSSIVDWKTDIKAPYTDQIKSWSYLVGRGIKPGVVWDRPEQKDTTLCEKPVITRVNLISTSNAPTFIVDSKIPAGVHFNGPDDAEYKIVNNRIGYNPFEGFIMNPGDTVWVDYQFSPDLSKPWPAKYATRRAQLVAVFYTNAAHTETDSTVIELYGEVLYPGLKVINPVSDTIQFGIVPLNTPMTQLATVEDTATAAWTFATIQFGPPILGITNSNTGVVIKQGDTVDLGQLNSLTFTVEAELNGIKDTVVPITLIGQQTCAEPIVIWVHISATNTQLLGTGFPAKPTFINCREYQDSIKATNTNKSDVSWTLTEVKLVSTPANPDAAEFSLINPANGNRVQTLNPGVALSPGQSKLFDVVYHPSKPGAVSTEVLYTFDSLNLHTTIKTVTAVITGLGLAEKTTLSAENPNPVDPKYNVPAGTYVEETANNLTVPIRFVADTISEQADAQRITFDVTFAKDLLDLKNPPFQTSGNYTLNTAPIVTDGATTTTIHLELNTTGNQPISKLDELGKLNFQVMDAVDQTTNFVISNMTYYDSKGVSICYVVTDTIPGLFVPARLCGDSTIIDLLRNGKITMKIVSLTPNPASQAKTPVLTYRVFEANTPVTVEVFNLLGQKIATALDQAPQSIGTHTVNIPVDGLESGTYNVMVTTPHSVPLSAQFILNR